MIDTALAYDKAHRYPDARAMQDAVRHAYDVMHNGAPITSRPRMTVPESVPDRTLRIGRGAASSRGGSDDRRGVSAGQTGVPLRSIVTPRARGAAGRGRRRPARRCSCSASVLALRGHGARGGRFRLCDSKRRTGGGEHRAGEHGASGAACRPSPHRAAARADVTPLSALPVASTEAAEGANHAEARRASAPSRAAGRAAQTKTRTPEPTELVTAMRRELSILMTVAVLLAAPHAHAQDAATLFQQGLAAYQRGDTAAACGLFERSYKAEAATGTLFNMAKCHATEGHYWEARGEFLKLAGEMDRAGKADKAKIARDAAARRREARAAAVPEVAVDPATSRRSRSTATSSTRRSGRRRSRSRRARTS